MNTSEPVRPVCRGAGNIGLAIVLIGGGIVLWEVICRLGLVSRIILPAPSAVSVDLYGALVEIIRGGPMRIDVLVTLYEIVAGFALSIVIGFVAGVLLAEIPTLNRALMPYIISLNAAPKIAFAPLLFVWFGFGMSSKIVMAALIAFFPLLVNVVTGIANADPAKLRLMQSLAASRWMVFIKVKLPDAMPMIFAGLKSSMVLAIVGAVVGEFISADAGLGHLINQTQYQMNVALGFAAIVLLSAIGMLLFYAIEFLERRVLFWNAPHRSG